MAHKDYYRILGLSSNASGDEIKKAYRELAMQYHPDRNHGKEEWANEKFKEINQAFSVLSDPEKRMHYDQFDTIVNIGNIFNGQAIRTPFEDLTRDFGGVDLAFGFPDDVFGNILKRRGFSFKTFSGGFGRSGHTRYETQNGIDLEDLFLDSQHLTRQSVNYEITITSEQAAKGIAKDLFRRGKKLEVVIPAGVKTGSKVRLINALQTTDGQPGDIVIDINIK